MAEKRMQAFTFYGSYYDSIMAIDEDEDLCDETKNKMIANLVRGICDYMFYEKEPEFKGTTKATYLAIKPNLDSSIAKHKSGKAGAEAKQADSKRQADEQQTDSREQADDKQEDSKPQADDKQAPSNTKTNTKTKINNKINNKKEINKEKVATAPVIKAETLDDVLSRVENTEFRDSLREFIKMRKAIRRPLITSALKSILEDLNKLSKSEEEKIAIVKQSVKHSWQGVFPIKGEENRGNASQPKEDFSYLDKKKEFEL